MFQRKAVVSSSPSRILSTTTTTTNATTTGMEVVTSSTRSSTSTSRLYQSKLWVVMIYSTMILLVYVAIVSFNSSSNSSSYYYTNIKIPNVLTELVLQSSSFQEQDTNNLATTTTTSSTKDTTNTDDVVQDIQNEKNILKNTFNINNDNNSIGIHDHIHIVFSTGCTPYQDWQSYVFFYQVYKSGQMGHVTRIISGCVSDRKKSEQIENHKRYIVNTIPTGDQNRFHVHISPDNYASTKVDGVQYRFFNKPFGIEEWMINQLRMPSDFYNNTMFIILDPDQIIIKPFTTNDFSTSNHHEWYTQKGVKQIENPYLVQDNNPIAQVYGLGTNWKTTVDTNKELVFNDAYSATLNDTITFPDPENIRDTSHLHTWTNKDVDNYYVVGPPYILTGYDLYRIVKVWAGIVVTIFTIFDQGFLSEMFAYSTAAAYLNIRHEIGSNLMISNAHASVRDEGWSTIDALRPNQICINMNYNDTTTSSIYDKEYIDALPYVIHYCQEYLFGIKYYFFKHFMSDKLLSCDHPLILDPNDYVKDPMKDDEDQFLVLSYKDQVEDIMYNGEKVKLNFQYKQRQLVMLCHIIPRVNDALIYWKQNHCLLPSDHVNYDKTYIIPH